MAVREVKVALSIDELDAIFGHILFEIRLRICLCINGDNVTHSKRTTIPVFQHSCTRLDKLMCDLSNSLQTELLP